MTVIAEGTVRTDRHETFYLESGPREGPLLVFVHGWPALSIMWRRQLEHFGALGYRCIAPDMRGYGRSSAPRAREDYALELIVQDMVAEAVSGSKTPKEAMQRAKERADRYYKV